MGYYTYYELSVHSYGKEDPKKTCREILEKILEMNHSNEDKFYPVVNQIKRDGIVHYDESNFEICTEETKWYENHEEMIELSRCFPEVTFKLHGDGEEAGDSWDAYYKNGKSCEYTAVIPPLNPDDLK